MKNHLSYLDALRGTAALWVLVSHACVLNAVSWPIVSNGGLAVDLFMILSGFLMTFHYYERAEREPWSQPTTWRIFWTRRFFRIAPLFYFLLILSFLIGPEIGAFRDQIASVWPTTATTASRYLDRSLANIATHITFLFGVLPGYAFRTPMPDWSIGLEMQFYAVFPFLMLAWARFGAVIAGACALAIALALRFAFTSYFSAYEMPANLALKIDVFLAGMLLAAAVRTSRHALLMAAASLLALIPFYLLGMKSGLSTKGQLVIAAAFGFLVLHRLVAKATGVERVLNAVDLLNNRVFRFLGDTSYSVYLTHLFIMIPLVGFMTTRTGYVALPEAFRVTITSICTAAVAYTIGWILHRHVEQPGIAVGKKISSSGFRRGERRSDEKSGAEHLEDAVKE